MSMIRTNIGLDSGRKKIQTNNVINSGNKEIKNLWSFFKMGHKLINSHKTHMTNKRPDALICLFLFFSENKK